MSGRVLIIGGTSAIARAAARVWAEHGNDVVLAGRDVEELERSVEDLRVRFGVTAQALKFDAMDVGSVGQFFGRVVGSSGPGADAPALAGVVLCQGVMFDQQRAQGEFDLARRMIETNYTSSVALLELVASYFEKRKAGFICALSSVAGDRGRQSNYLYGSTKAALTTYLQGLRNRLARSGVAVVTVKPGFVDTAMTWGLPGLFLVATPMKVAGDMHRAVVKQKNQIYTPWFWWGIMSIIKSVPEPIFKRLKL